MGKKRVYENKWTFRGKEFNSEDIGIHESFVYLITAPDNRKYIGVKSFTSVRKQSDKTKNRRKRQETDWQHYYGSSQTLKFLVDDFGKENFKREIVSLHKTRGCANKFEVKMQFSLDVLERDDYLNENINSKWHKTPLHILEAREVDIDLISEKM